MTTRSPLTLDDILAIHGNRPVFDALVSALQGKEAIAFVGAGASTSMYPLWNKLIERLADYAVAEGKADERDAARWKADTKSTPQQRVNILLRRLGDALYHKFLKETFGPREGADGKRYTETHAVLMRLPFRGYVTTNYDPGLDFARMELRPRSLTTGIPIWRDDDEVYRWYSGDVFKSHDDCPILWLHGSWQRPNEIVLNSGEYATAYKPSLYRNLFNSLWGQRHLVFVGFGFNDPQFTFMVGEYLRDLRDANAVPRHVAVLGLTMNEDGTSPDEEAVREWRENLEADYHVRPLFYPVFGDDHTALCLLLDAVAYICGCPAAAPAATPSVQVLETAHNFAANWFHEPTNDDKFVGREDEIARLDRWVRDLAVRVIGVSAIGGAGKTALVGHWLKNTKGWLTRPFEGLFAWSFYQNRSMADFLRELLHWSHDVLGTPEPGERTTFARAALHLLRNHALVVLLDGLEVLQEGPEEARHGTFLDGALRELLVALCRREHRSLVVLTSRFVFADLTRFLGASFHQLELRGLLPEQGASLLDELDVGGHTSERKHVSESLDGHPLGLRIFADAILDQDREYPRRFLEYAFRLGNIPEGAPLNDKLRRLLIFYEQKLPPSQTRLLTVVALFRAPVADETVVRLARGLFERKNKELLPDDGALASDLHRLQTRGILSREPIEGGHGSACHPILRDHFRALLLRTGATVAGRTANLLTGQPSSDKPQSIKEIEPVLLAIELLLDAGEFRAANELYISRLNNGWVFSTMPAPREGVDCALGFVKDEARQQLCKEELGNSRLTFYLNEVGLFAVNSGRFELALHYQDEANASIKTRKSATNLITSWQNKSELLAILGRLDEAQHTATKALQIAKDERNQKEIDFSLGYRCWPTCLLGQIQRSAEDFALASKNVSTLYSLGRFQWAELLVRSGKHVLATRRIHDNLLIHNRNQWNAYVARCHWILGWCALIEGKLNVAEAKLRQAEAIFYRGQLLFDLARLHITAGGLALARRDADDALYYAEEALTLAAPRGMRFVHADALVLRGRGRLLKDEPDAAERALDDAEEALRLARECGYAWGERDALFLETEAHATHAEVQLLAGDELAASRAREAAGRARDEAEALAARLVLTDEDLAAAEAKAVAWLKAW
jgi:hypothetical protein